MKINQLVLSILLTLSSFSINAAGARRPDPFNYRPAQQQVFKLNTLYQRDKINHQSIDLTIKPDGSWNVVFRIGFVGAYALALTNSEERKRLADFFRTSAKDVKYKDDSSFYDIKTFTKGQQVSLSNNPKIKVLIERQMANVSRLITAQKAQLGIDFNFSIQPIFIDEKELLASIGVRRVTRENLTSYYEYFRTHPLSYHPILFLPTPDPNVVTPDFWDFYSRPEYLAHETIHLITREHSNDGFIYRDYPFDGLTNSGPYFRELEKMGYSPQLDRSIFLAFVVGHPALHQIFGDQPEAYFGGNSPFKEYMDSDEKGKYSEKAEDWTRNFEWSKARFLERIKARPTSARAALTP